eukprot:gnl/Hemi2/8728_TR3024_c0_g1_i1.p1 gnl/Hemi2/8728_TR3024_c0_g1~~gnl/Hemi2/8728_TR3024_c0_g1_i1.p1  ORF type:complete len:193 (-),score=36.45 gnl/Hemi2/8728_TR3024_c0_g1_i1:90-629(-)
MPKWRHMFSSPQHKMAVLRNMVTQLIQYERIRTTVARAKESKILAERMITWAKQGDLHAKQRARRYIYTRSSMDKLFSELGPRFKDRNGGYTRIFLDGHRMGDKAPMAMLEYVYEDGKRPPIKGAPAPERPVYEETVKSPKRLRKEARDAAASSTDLASLAPNTMAAVDSAVKAATATA